MKLLLARLSVFILLVVGCNSAKDNSLLDTDKLVGKSLDNLISEYHLAEALHWDMPNMPPDEDSLIIYFLEDGNLDIRLNHDAMVTAASFEERSDTPNQRIADYQRDWSEYVRDRTPESGTNKGDAE